MARIELTGVAKSFGATRALRAMDLEIGSAEFVALLGPSGCGKTTILRLIAGFETPDTGEIRIGERVVAASGWALEPEARRIGMVFQSYALWPHMSVAENVGFSLRVRGEPAAERMRRVAAALELVGLAEMAQRRPQHLSGGQRQRVALARCLAMQPDVVLLDEPLANLDQHLREAMQLEFRRLHRELGVTFIFVTHDQSEALALADRVCVMDQGAVQQVASPRALYHEPATAMVARFIGGGFLAPARILGVEGERVAVEMFGARFLVRGKGRAGEAGTVCLRPSDMDIVSTGGVEGQVSSVRYLGAMTEVTVIVPGAGAAFKAACRGEPPAPGAPVRIAARDGWLLPA